MPPSTGVLSAPDGIQLGWRAWKPELDAGVVVVLVHGAGEHGGRYEELVARLVAEGITVFAADLRGHGRSGGRRGSIRRFSDHLGDIDAFVTFVRLQRPRDRLFLLGHSLGSLLVADYVLSRPPTLAGAVLTAPALGAGARISNVWMTLARALGEAFPRLPLLALTARDSGAPDPLRYTGRFDARVISEFLGTSERVLRQASDLRLPLLVVHGTDDRTADPEASRRLVADAGSADKSFLLYDGARHALFDSPRKADIAKDVAEWLIARGQASSTDTF